MPYLRLGATDLVWRRAKNGVNSALCASPLALLGASPAGVLRHRVAQSGDGVAGQARFATGVSHMWRTPRMGTFNPTLKSVAGRWSCIRLKWCRYRWIGWGPWSGR